MVPSTVETGRGASVCNPGTPDWIVSLRPARTTWDPVPHPLPPEKKKIRKFMLMLKIVNF